MKPTLIRALDPEIYKRFKAAAVLRGITLSQAFNEAMKLWLDKYGETVVKSVEDINDEFLTRAKSEIDKRYKGKYVIIAEGRIAAVVDTLRDAYKILGKYGLDKCTIYKAGEAPEEGEWLWSSIEP